jgi:hypothetical protein
MYKLDKAFKVKNMMSTVDNIINITEKSPTFKILGTSSKF